MESAGAPDDIVSYRGYIQVLLHPYKRASGLYMGSFDHGSDDGLIQVRGLHRGFGITVSGAIGCT